MQSSWEVYVDQKHGSTPRDLSGYPVRDACPPFDKQAAGAASSRKRPYLDEKVDYNSGEEQTNGARGGASVFISARDQLVS